MSQPPKIRLTRDERSMIRVRAVGQKVALHEDLYHAILTRSWAAFFASVALVFLAINAMFGAAYHLAPGCISGVTTFSDAFFFSVQTFATIGYGGMAPVTLLGHLIVTVEAVVGMLSMALITGITFAKFARPTARVLFCHNAVIAPRNGVPHLMFRMANFRHNQVLEARLNVFILVTETTVEGETLRRPYPIKLVRETTPLFALSWTAMHEIDSSSPFYGPDAMGALREKGAELFLALSGLDETIAQTIHARYRYTLDDILPGRRFADVTETMADGTRVIDYAKFHETIPVDAASQAT